MKKRSRLNAKERAMLRNIGMETIELRYDWRRRLRNALRCLRSVDPDWRAWCKRELRKGMRFQVMTRKVEARARKFVLKNYSFAGIHDRENWFFTDQGNLSPG